MQQQSERLCKENFASRMQYSYLPENNRTKQSNSTITSRTFAQEKKKSKKKKENLNFGAAEEIAELRSGSLFQIWSVIRFLKPAIAPALLELAAIQFKLKKREKEKTKNQKNDA